MTDEQTLTRHDLEVAVQNAALSVQMAEVIKDIGALNLRMDQHDMRHDREENARVISRRWIIATAIAFLAAIEGPLLFILAHIVVKS